MYLLIKSKDKIGDFLNENLTNQTIRVLLRDTEDYNNFLSLSLHPSCMVDFIEHEKVLENLWHHSFFSSELIPHEINSLTFCDIPYFYTFVRSLDLSCMSGIIHNYFINNTFTKLHNHIAKLNSLWVDYSVLLINESTNSLDVNIKNVPILRRPHSFSPLLCLATDIKDLILENVFIDKKEQRIIWPDLLPSKSPISFTIYYPEISLYNGTSGLYIFLYTLNYLTHEMIPILPILETEVFLSNIKECCLSAFDGYGVRILTAFVCYELSNDLKFLNYLKQNIKILLDKTNYSYSSEWLNGTASLISILSIIYKEIKENSALTLLNKLVKNINIKENGISGFAHGYAGTLYSLICANSILNDDSIYKDIIKLYNLLLTDLKPKTSSWCQGTLGINKALKALSTYYPEICDFDNIKIAANKNTELSSCLCHGEYGNFTAVIEQYTTNEISFDDYSTLTDTLINSPIKLLFANKAFPLGMFTGLSGIGYQLLRIYDNSILDILFFSKL